jgi:hypothetical protein
MGELEKRFQAERERLRAEFEKQREKFMPRGPEKRGPEGRGPEGRGPEGRPEPFRGRESMEDLLHRLMDRVERLEERLDRGMRGFDRFRDFDFRQFERMVPPKFREYLPRFEEKDFRFEFKREAEPGKKAEKKPAPEEHPKKKPVPEEKKKEKKSEDEEKKEEPKKHKKGAEGF